MENNLSKTTGGPDKVPKRFSAVTKGLIYISETDAEIVPYLGEKAETVTRDEILRQTDRSPGEPFEEISPDAFFSQLIAVKEWFDTSRKERAEKFAALYEELKGDLRDLHVFRIGRIRIDIYVVGIDVEDRLAGITTHAVET